MVCEPQNIEAEFRLSSGFALDTKRMTKTKTQMPNEGILPICMEKDELVKSVDVLPAVIPAKQAVSQPLFHSIDTLYIDNFDSK